MINLDEQTQEAQSYEKQVPRDFIEIRARDRNDQSPVTDYLWSGVEDIFHSSIDPFTGDQIEHFWTGAGHLVGVGSVMRVSNLTITRTVVRLSEVSSRVNDLIREYDPKYGTVIFYRSFIDPETRNFVSPARARFVGQIDSIDFIDPAAGSSGGVEVTCKSALQDFTRTNPATRSHSYQKMRKSGDTFRKYAATIGQREFNWGKAGKQKPAGKTAVQKRVERMARKNAGRK